MSTYLNENGLVDGNIPTGKPCPFHRECKFKMDRCPTEDNLKGHSFSCAAARLFSLCAKKDEA